MKRSTFFLFGIAFGLLLNCQKQQMPLEVELQKPSASILNNNIVITQFNYDSVLVQNSPNFSLHSPKILRVQVGNVEKGRFVVKSDTIVTYQKMGNRYYPEFKCKIGFDLQTLIVKLQVRFLFNDNSFNDLDTVITLCNYPYPSAEVVYRYEDFMDENILFAGVQDFDLKGSLLFFHPFGGYGAYQFDLAKKSLKYIYRSFGGDYLALDENGRYLFIDDTHQLVVRYNVQQSQDSAVVIHSFLEKWLKNKQFDIRGMEASDTYLYVLYGNTIYQMDFQGTIIDSLPYFERHTYSFAYADGMLFSIDDDSILAYNIQERRFTDAYPAPIKYVTSIKIDNGYLYFTYFKKEFIGRVPLEDVLKAGKPIQKINL